MSFGAWITAGIFRRKNKSLEQVSENNQNQMSPTADTKQDINKLINESERLFRSHNEIIGEKDKQIYKLETELEEKQATIAGMEELLQAQQKKIKEFREAGIPNQKQKVTEKSKTRIETETISKEHQELIKKYENSTKKLKNEIAEINKEHQEAKSRFEKEREVTAALEKDLEKQRKIDDELRKELEGYEVSIQKLRNELAEINNRYEYAIEKLNNATDKIACFEMLILDLDKELGLSDLVKKAESKDEEMLAVYI